MSEERYQVLFRIAEALRDRLHGYVELYSEDDSESRDAIEAFDDLAANEEEQASE